MENIYEVGDELICLDNKYKNYDHSLTIGKSYIIKYIVGSVFVIEGDNGKNASFIYLTKSFKCLIKERDKKLNLLLFE